ncbi:CdaR family protein [Sporobacter termitidis]|nr:CdaR family protein [Sporobacter termitidis]
MLKERMRKIFGSKVFYIVFSLLASMTIWLYVAYVENPNVTVSVRGIKVEFINEDYLTDRSLVITKTNYDTVSLNLLGRRNTVSQLTNSNIKITADLSVIKSAGVYRVPYTVTYPIDINPASVTITGRSSDNISVTADSLVTKDIQVRATYDGGVAEGYQAEPIEVKPDTISVSGPKEVVSKISNATVTVLRENISKTVEDDLPVMLVDENGRQVTSDKLVLSQKTVTVKIPVLKVKTVPLTVNLTPGAGADNTNTVCSITPSDISISGDSETLDSLNQIVLGTIDLSQFLTSTTQTFKIALPNGTTNLTGTTEATVSVTINGLDSKHVNATNIQVSNVTDGYTATVVTTSMDVVLRGKTAALTNIAPDNIRIVADLTELGATTGIYSVLAKVYVDGDSTGIGAVGEYKITVAMAKS